MLKGKIKCQNARSNVKIMVTGQYQFNIHYSLFNIRYSYFLMVFRFNGGQPEVECRQQGKHICLDKCYQQFQ